MVGNSQMAFRLGNTALDSLITEARIITAKLYADKRKNAREVLQQQIAEDLNIDYSFGIHWGTFFLSKEPLFEPPELINKYQRLNSEKIFSTSKPGQLILLDSLEYQTILGN